MIVVEKIPLKEEKEGGKEGLEELLSSMLELLGKTGKAEAGLLHHLTPAERFEQFEKTRRRHSNERDFEHLRSWTHDTRGRWRWRREEGKACGLRHILHHNLILLRFLQISILLTFQNLFCVSPTMYFIEPFLVVV